MNNQSIIIPVASGKGGVGKTFVAVNLAFALASMGKKTILIDLDFGGANVHTCLGYTSAPDGVGNFINQRKLGLGDFLLGTSQRNLYIIAGDAEMVGLADLSTSKKKRLLNEIMQLDAEYIILDLGAGSAVNTIDFFMISSFGILVAMPEFTSIVNAYALLKNSIFRLLYTELKQYPEVKKLFNRQMKKGGESAWKISELLNNIFRIDPEIYANASAMLDTFNPKLVINIADKPGDLEMGEKLRKISKTYLSIETEYLGFLYRDSAVHESIVNRTPLAQMNARNTTYEAVLKMAYKIINAKRLPYFLLDIDHYDESLDILIEEATDDLAGRLEGYEELADENLLSINEFVSITKNLEFENLELKRKVAALEKELLRYKGRK